MKRIGLRTQLSLAFAGVAFLTTMVAFLISFWAVHSSVDDWSRERARETAVATAVAAAEARTPDGWTPAAHARLARDLALTGMDHRIVDGAGRTIHQTPGVDRLPASRVPDASAQIPGAGGARVDVFAINRPGQPASAGAIQDHLDLVYLLAALFAALLASLVGFLAASRLARPLRRLAAAAPRLARTQAHEPLPGDGPPEVRQLAEALEQLSEDLARQRRARSQLAQDLAHELRTPLTLAQGRLEAMEDGVVPLDAQGVADVHRDVVRLGRLVGEIERLAEAEVTPRHLDIERVDLSEIAREQEAVVVAAGGRFQTACTGAVPASADRDAVRQILGNLVSNALRHGPGGGRVVVGTRLVDGTAELRVTDDGAGVPDGQRIFDRFARGEGARDSDGIGIGLTIARGLADAQGGSLGLDPDADRTTFVLRLPAGTEAPDQ